MTRLYQIGNFKKYELYKKNYMEILELKSTVTEMKNSLEELNSRFELVEERIHELEHRLIDYAVLRRGNKE